jgi:hypothetical protein
MTPEIRNLMAGQRLIEKALGLDKPTPERCPICEQFGTFIRTRYFEGGTADVWMCVTPSCKSYRLYWHKDKPTKGVTPTTET